MIKAFVGHSFEAEDESVVIAFAKMFGSLEKSIDFEWEDADVTQIKPLSKKVPQKMADKNLFIGIFTKKHIEIEEKRLLKTMPWNRDKYIFRKTDCAYGTSYWITQESGYAIAQGMATLFLIEKGVRELKGLHADREHVYFERGRESDCFLKLNEALAIFLKENNSESEKEGSNISPKESVKEINIAVSEDVNVEEAIETEQDEQKETKEPEETKNDKYYFKKIYFALLRKEKPKFEELKKEVFERYKDDDNSTIEWQAKILSLESLLTHKDVFNDLIGLQKKNPDNPLIAYYIGEEYEKYKNYGKAIEEYLKSATYETNIGAKLYRISLAAHAYVKNGQKVEAVDILLKELRDDLVADEKHLIYGYLSDITKSTENNDLFTAFSEKALLLNPSNNLLRFSLAYKYSNMDKDKLALYHYNILAANSPDTSNYNNLGVAYANLEMPSKAVECYIKASELGATISRINLAQKLLNEGFIDYANEQLKEARKSESYEKDDMGKALSRIDRIREKEVKKEKEVLAGIGEERQFKLDYADAYSVDFIVGDTLNGDWNSKHGKIELNFGSDNTLYGKKEETVEDNNLLWSMMLAAGSGGATPEKQRVKFTRTFQGKIVKNRTFEYKLKVERQPLNGVLPVQGMTISEFSGYGIIDKMMNLMKVVEFDKDKKQSFLEITKV